MKLAPIVVSLLDTDLYNFNMDQVIFHKHTDLCGQYYFKCRNAGVKFTPEMAEEIEAQVRANADKLIAKKKPAKAAKKDAADEAEGADGKTSGSTDADEPPLELDDMPIPDEFFDEVQSSKPKKNIDISVD